MNPCGGILIVFASASLQSDSSDFENKFVCGEIMSYADLKEHGSEAAVKAVGILTRFTLILADHHRDNRLVSYVNKEEHMIVSLILVTK